MTGFGDSWDLSWWGYESYGGSSVKTKELEALLSARIISTPIPSPPIIDTIAEDLAHFFDYIQQGIQAYDLFGKLEYTKGSDLDNHFGRIYDLPRLANEDDDAYRIRLKTYLSVLTGSGTIPACQSVLDAVLDLDGGSIITSLWPGQVLINFSTEALPIAKARKDIITSILPGMFAAGTTYELLIPYIELIMTCGVLGNATMNQAICVGVANDDEISLGLDTAVFYGNLLNQSIRYCAQMHLDTESVIAAAIRTENYLDVTESTIIQIVKELDELQGAYVQAWQSISLGQRGAIRVFSRDLSEDIGGAIAREFDLTGLLLTRLGFSPIIEIGLDGAIQKQLDIDVGIRTRIARLMT